MTREEKVMRVVSEAMQDVYVVPEACLPMRLGDDTVEVKHNSISINVDEAAEHDTIDKVWEMSGTIKLFIKETSVVRDEIRRGWMTEIQEWLDEAGILDQVNALDECVHFYQLEGSGAVDWSEADRSIFGEMNWSCVVNVG